MPSERHGGIEFDEQKIDFRDQAATREMFRRFVQSLETQFSDISRRLRPEIGGRDEVLKRSWLLE